jgi:hypothetical protein
VGRHKTNHTGYYGDIDIYTYYNYIYYTKINKYIYIIIICIYMRDIWAGLKNWVYHQICCFDRENDDNLSISGVPYFQTNPLGKRPILRGYSW